MRTTQRIGRLICPIERLPCCTTSRVKIKVVNTDVILRLVLVGFLVLVAGSLYLLPTIIAMNRRHRNALAIFVLDVFLGWTFIGWVVALVWSFTTTSNYGDSSADELAQTLSSLIRGFGLALGIGVFLVGAVWCLHLLFPHLFEPQPF